MTDAARHVINLRMALRLNQSIMRDEIDNREKGRVKGLIWVVGREEPIELDLKGNAHPDVAGSLLTFTDPAPGPGDETTNLRILPVGYPSGVGLKLTP